MDAPTKAWWIITVGGGYGAFAFYGYPDEAEEMRAHKARWEGAVAKLRAAEETKADADMIVEALQHFGWRHP